MKPAKLISKPRKNDKAPYEMTAASPGIVAQSNGEEDIQALRVDISRYRTALNHEGVWLFLATLGCWGVTQPLLQFMAYGMTIVLFADTMSKHRNDKRSFAKIIKSIEERIIEVVPEGEARKAALYDLAALQKFELSTIRSLKKTKTFFFCWVFFCASVYYACFPYFS